MARVEVADADTYRTLLESQGVRLDAPELDETFQELSLKNQEVNLTESHLETRQFSCSQTQAMVTDKTYDFIGWDVQMSPVYGQGDATIYSGYTTSNTISVNGNVDLTWAKDAAKSLFGINYSRQWTTSSQLTFKGTVTKGNHGTIITRPRKTRRIGRVMSGCPGSFTQIGTFQADSHLTGSYKGIDWVSGSIELCQKPQFPLTLCHGPGTFI
ncbi:uncharacterized protein CTRU02_214607 [Colletotrichum truncatum]|uniref:Uncharacterized protein n=1 Tax=Colletotrichum truncatum TaxID=5467 RepID=A0ACC3YF96_COLTU|nr:uncharacterized protein CTRU02_09555 [Colletotrichum truncatum]KAF6788237.1 hypothetical protein CTRU02_09555 [Colletotrichum truncatum]